MNEIARRLAAHLFDVPLIQNQYRSAFVEMMIEPFLRDADWKYTGDGWSGWDFEHRDGARLEVKQSAALQTWSRTTGLRTRGAFDIAARKGFFDEGGARYTIEAGRPAHLYVFAWHGIGDSERVDHRDALQWVFYVVRTGLLPDQKSISLPRVHSLIAQEGRAPVTLPLLARTVDRERLKAPLPTDC